MKQPIDIVIYWVDGNDPEWKLVYKKYTKKEPNRFRDVEVLKYIFRGIEKNLPWVRYIHFVTWGHLPKWLDTTNPKLRIHSHEDIFYFKDALPVFNSSAIEANFANIPGLSEQFVLFNDDMLVLNPLDETRFFCKGKPVDYIKLSFPRSGFIYNYLKPQNAQHVKFINNAYQYLPSRMSIKLIKRGLFSRNYSLLDNFNNFLFALFIKIFWFEVYHHPQPHLKSTWVKFIEEHKYDVIKSTVYSKFRSQSDINQYLYRYLNLSEGNFYPSKPSDNYSIYVRSSNDLDESLLEYSMLCICEDDKMNDNEFEIMKSKLIGMLDRKLPYKSRYEK